MSVPALCLLALFFAKDLNYQIQLRSSEGAEPALFQSNKLYAHSADGGCLISSGILYYSGMCSLYLCLKGE